MRNVSEKERIGKREMNIISIVAVACDMWTNIE
jgi:hypothetical protein